METKYNVLQNYAIKIEYQDKRGSGVVFSVGEKNVILTAFHVLDSGHELNEKDLSLSKSVDGCEFEIDFDVKEFIYEKETDLAILLITSSEVFHELKFVQPKIGQKVKLYGYPDILSDSEDTHAFEVEGKIRELNQKRMCVTIDDKLGTLDTEEKYTLNGFSGSGFYMVTEETVRLCGIETNVLEKSVPYNAICGVSTDALVEICARAKVIDEKLISKDTVSDIVRHSELYMRQLVPLDDFSMRSKSDQRLGEEYREGIDAHPDYIRKNLDIRRDKWIRRIRDSFAKAATVVIRGASGQGKTSLAYRYLIENYSEQQIICIKKVNTENAIWPIIRFLQNELRNREYILYYDVQPGDRYWGQFLANISDYMADILVLVTVREDDFNANGLRRSRIHYEEIALELSEEEAKEIYAQYRQHVFLSFDDIWECFGKGGPLLEFTYLLNHSMTLEEKINFQVTQIDDRVDERDWFSALAVIAIAGQYDLSVRLDRLFEIVSIKNVSRLLQQFEKEFFVKISDDGDRIKCLHAVRARLIIKSLEGKFGFNYANAVLSTLSAIEDSAVYLLPEYIEKNGLNLDFVNKLSSITYTSFVVIEDVLRGLLWYSIVEYQRINKDIIETGNALYSNNYLLLAVLDTTGFIKKNDKEVPGYWVVLEKKHPGIYGKAQALVNKQPQRYLKYDYAIRFLSNIAEYIKDYVANNSVKERSLGYVLFWAKILGVSININSTISIEDDNDFVGIAELIKGLLVQGHTRQAEEIKKQYEKEIFIDCNIVSLFSKDKEIFAEVIPNNYSLSKENNTLKSAGYNEQCMYAINILSCLYPNMRRYNVQLLGTKLGDIVIPDTKKNIPLENLPEKWITELNGIGIRMQEYQYAPQDWKEVFDNISSYRNVIIDLFEEVLKQLSKFYKFYKKRTFDFSKINNLILSLNIQKGFELPKCARDRFGIKNDAESLKAKNSYENPETEGINKSFNNDDHLWVGEICNKYFTGINNYVNGFHSLIEGLAVNKDSIENSRLQLFNIVSSYDLYRVFTEKVDSFFAAYINTVDDNRERIALEKIVAMTHWIYINGYRQENNVVYEAYELFKKKRRAIDYFLEHELEDFPETKKVFGFEKEIFLYADIRQSDNLLEKIYQRIQSLVGKRELISPARGYLFNTVVTIRLVLSNDECEDFLTICIPIKSFTIAKDIDQFHQFLFGAEKFFSFVPKEYIKNGAIASVTFIVNQLVQIEEALLQNARYSLAESIEAINNSFRMEIEEISKKVEILQEYRDLYLDISKIGSLDLITVDEVECQHNMQVLEDFVVKYSDSM